MKIIALGGSNSKNSINKQLAVYSAKLITQAEVKVIDLNDFEMPIYGIDEENKNGIPKKAEELLKEIHSADGIVISLAEHNGAYSAVFKSIYDWMSRINPKLWNNIPMLLMATSPGGRGGLSVLEIAKNTFPRMGANLVGTFSLPFFTTNFSENGIQDVELKNKLDQVIQLLEQELN